MAETLNASNQRLLMALRGRVLILTGSGISADSGIPTFRGEGGYWRTYAVEELATRAAFDRHPDVVWRWYRERRATIRSAQPNAAHEALVALAWQCQEFLLVTQNVDDLHERATADGRTLAPEQVVHIHGDIFTNQCPRCGHSQADRDVPGAAEMPRCSECDALMRPGVVWFDEELDSKSEGRIREFVSRGDCDAVLAIGTTATFDYIRNWALQGRGRKGWLVEVNPHETCFSSSVDQRIRERAAFVLPNLVRLAFERPR